MALRLRRRYPWVPMEDLKSYSYYGLARAARKYRADQGVEFKTYLASKGFYLAVDAMRHDRVIRRRGDDSAPRFVHLRSPSEKDGQDTPIEHVPDPDRHTPPKRSENRELVATLLKQLDHQDRRLMLMRYAEDMSFREIGEVFGRSEATISLRHKRVMAQLRRSAARMAEA